MRDIHRSRPTRVHDRHHQQQEDYDDDKTVIFYKEKEKIKPWNFSQTSCSNSCDQTVEAKVATRHKKGECDKNHRYQSEEHETLASDSMSRKRRYRNLGNSRLNLRQRQGFTADTSTLPKDVPEQCTIDDDVDDFASLIDKLSPAKKMDNSPQGLSGGNRKGVCSHEAETSPRQSSHNNTVKQSQLDHESIEASKMTNSIRSIEVHDKNKQNYSEGTSKTKSVNERELCSPPDFDFFGSEDHDDENGDSKIDDSFNRLNTTTKVKAKPTDLRARHQKSQFESDGRNKHQSYSGKRRRENQNHYSDQDIKVHRHDRIHSGKQLSVSSSATAFMSKGRMRKRPDMVHRSSAGSTLNSEKENRQDSRQPVQVATNVKSVKSIVGLRPTHWHRSARTSKKERSNSLQINGSQQLAKASALAAATRVTSKALKRTIYQTKYDLKNTPERSSATTMPSSIEKNAVVSALEKKKDSSKTSKPCFSFAPSFVPTKSKAVLDDAIGEDDSEDECRVTNTPTSSSFASTTPPFSRRRRSKNATGEWVRRFITLRNSHSNDSVRIQNKAFARQRLMLDVSDPRKRAKTYTDVTILGQYAGPWINVPDELKVTVLGHVHRHKQLKHSSDTNRNHKENLEALCEDFHAWVTFTLATARRIELHPGCSLRIYNAIILPSRLPTAFDFPPSSKHSADNKSSGNCDKNIICTNLCERISSLN